MISRAQSLRMAALHLLAVLAVLLVCALSGCAVTPEARDFWWAAGRACGTTLFGYWLGWRRWGRPRGRDFT